MKVRCTGQTDIGLKREVNQDSFGMSDPAQSEQLGQLLVVCDGMGGHEAGEIASRIGVETILEQYYQDTDQDRPVALEQAFFEANRRINEQGPGNMGTTGVAALFLNNTLYVANVGDSRAYLIREGQMSQISRDHSLVAEQVAAGIVSAEQARHLNYRNMITRALGYRPEVQVDIFPIPLQEGDIVLLSSDGLHGLVEDDEIAQIVLTSKPDQAIRRLIGTANDRGGGDNITVALGIVEALDPQPPRTGTDDLSETMVSHAPTVQLDRAAKRADDSDAPTKPNARPPSAAGSGSPPPPPQPPRINLNLGLGLVGGAVFLILVGAIGIFFLGEPGQGQDQTSTATTIITPSPDDSRPTITTSPPTEPLLTPTFMPTISSVSPTNRQTPGRSSTTGDPASGGLKSQPSITLTITPTASITTTTNSTTTTPTRPVPGPTGRPSFLDNARSLFSSDP
jgi:protein phosphatase